MDMKTIGTNIKILMSVRRMTQKELAVRTQLSPTTIKNALTGKSISVETLNRISDVLEMPLPELLTPFEVPNRIRFRAEKKLKNRAVILHDIMKWVNDYELVEKLLNRKRNFKLKGLVFTDDTELLATEARKKLGLRKNEPIQDVALLLDEAGIKLKLYQTLSEGFLGLSMFDNTGSPVIVINVNKQISVERQIFSSIHELGHLLMHLKSYEQQDDSTTEQYQKEELEANQFAGYFLMPTTAFCDIFDQTRGRHWIERVLYTKTYFRVSYKTILRRLIDIGYAQDDIYKRFVEEYKRLYGYLGFKDEPRALTDWFFTENRFSNLVYTAYIREDISASRAAEALNIPLDSFLEIAQYMGEK